MKPLIAQKLARQPRRRASIGAFLVTTPATTCMMARPTVKRISPLIGCRSWAKKAIWPLRLGERYQDRAAGADYRRAGHQPSGRDLVNKQDSGEVEDYTNNKAWEQLGGRLRCRQPFNVPVDSSTAKDHSMVAQTLEKAVLRHKLSEARLTMNPNDKELTTLDAHSLSSLDRPPVRHGNATFMALPLGMDCVTRLTNDARWLKMATPWSARYATSCSFDEAAGQQETGQGETTDEDNKLRPDTWKVVVAWRALDIVGPPLGLSLGLEGNVVLNISQVDRLMAELDG
ncbi:hypothetical protein CKAH01_01622 [Colletotrichum kahawae]|uniref:Uncharacterized protein n=1 Tax=Colletotrichum kahawae TaxID=34407 RepID=A0AAD9Y631_COLKA|nr:hypothetical protein CKAH01_01622 [Colletotrichum kahawae]